ncbi:DNA-binding NarL/FixJ family response regulator [Paenibacillus castaneae]|uniref:response regulator transcription factor n=1 Tax=Paenibacillus castaneae TaxID=474957 RepID=UPI000C998711|nr:response regulator transcription factor [Paenibacillus castaneae]NIK77769.1 DNA-binding NarL/FixJ family response regulator [Paenibacillus castaneae]
MIRIGIAEDQALIRESLAIILGLEPDMAISWTAATGTEAVSSMVDIPTDLILMDLRMPDMDGVTAIRRIRALEMIPQPQIIVLTTFHQEEWLLDALNAGAAACLIKEVPPNLLITAIRTITGNNWDPSLWTVEWRKYAPEIQFRTRLAGSHSGEAQEVLTFRDLAVLRKICSGATNKEIAADLLLSEGTVKNYVSTLYAKLGARHRAEAIKVALDRGLY